MTIQKSKTTTVRPRRTKAAAATTAAKTPISQTPEINSSHRGKLGVIIALLRRSEGASVPDMMEATGWQAHSVRGVISGTLKKKLGLTVGSTKEAGGERRYRVQAEVADDAA